MLLTRPNFNNYGWNTTRIICNRIVPYIFHTYLVVHTNDLQPINKNPLPIPPSYFPPPLPFHITLRPPPHKCSPPPVHRPQQKDIPYIPQQSQHKQPQRNKKRQPIPRLIARAKQLAADNTRQVPEPIDAEDEAAFPGFGRVAAKPGDGQRRGDVGAEEEDAEACILGAVGGGLDGGDEAGDTDEEADDDVGAAVFAVGL